MKEAHLEARLCRGGRGPVATAREGAAEQRAVARGRHAVVAAAAIPAQPQAKASVATAAIATAYHMAPTKRPAIAGCDLEAVT